MISEWGVPPPPSATGWFKKYKEVHLPLGVQNGVCPLFCNRVVKLDDKSSTIIIIIIITIITITITTATATTTGMTL